MAERKVIAKLPPNRQLTEQWGLAKHEAILGFSRLQSIWMSHHELTRDEAMEIKRAITDLEETCVTLIAECKKASIEHIKAHRI